MKRLANPPAEDVIPFLSSTPLLGGLDPDLLLSLSSTLSYIRLEDGEVLLHENRPAGSVYLVINGALQMYREADDKAFVPLSVKRRGESVGEMAVISCDMRRASARAVGSTTVARLSRNDLVRISRSRPETLSYLTEAVQRRQMESRLDDILHQNDLFKDLSQAARKDLGQELVWLAVPDDGVLMVQGEPGDFLAVIVSGLFRVQVELPDGQVIYVNELGPGETVGEMSIITGARRSATIRAVRDSEVVKLSKESFERLVERHPLEMMRTFTGGIINRLWNDPQGKERRVSAVNSIAIIPAAPHVPLGDFSRRLKKAFDSLGRTIHLNAEAVDQALERPGIAQSTPTGIHSSRLVTWLNAQENQSDILLMEADSGPTEWSARCLRQADLILIVGRAGDSPELGPIERVYLSEGGPAATSGRAVVLLHGENAGQATGTMAWLEPRQARSHHHVRQGRAADYERLARAISGQAVGLVLSGGGARGAAHIGVIRALKEAGVAIDHIGGNSAGAVIAAAYALDYRPDEIKSLMKQMYRPRNFFDPTLPLVSLFSRWRTDRLFREFIGDRLIEDLWLPFYCVSSNLTRAEVAVHDRGLLRRWLLASNSAPGMTPPVVHNGDLLLDGAMLDNFPVDIMREKIGAGTVIGVDVSPFVDLAENPDYGLHLSGWRVLWSRVNPAATPMKVPGIAAILQRASELSSKRDQLKLLSAEVADMVIRPPVGQFSLADSSALDEIEAIGYESALEQVRVWQNA